MQNSLNDLELFFSIVLILCFHWHNYDVFPQWEVHSMISYALNLDIFVMVNTTQQKISIKLGKRESKKEKSKYCINKYMYANFLKNWNYINTFYCKNFNNNRDILVYYNFMSIEGNRCRFFILFWILQLWISAFFLYKAINEKYITRWQFIQDLIKEFENESSFNNIH